MVKTALTPSAKRILSYLEEHKSGSHRRIKASLKMSDDDYNDARQALLELGRAAKFSCYAGGLKLPESDTSKLPGVDSGQLEAAKKRSEDEIAKSEARQERLERDLYPYVKKWATTTGGYEKVAVVGDNHARDKWENPDLVAVIENDLDWLTGVDIEVTSFEVKLSLDVFGLWQAAHYRFFSHYVYLAVYEPPEDVKANRLYDRAVQLGLGILCLTKSGHAGSGVRCTEINSPGRQVPRPAEVDSILADCANLLALEKPGKGLLRQISGQDSL